MSINIRTSFLGKMLYYLSISIFLLSTGIVMAAGMHDVRTANNEVFELEGNTTPNEWNPPNELDDFDEIYRDIAWILHPSPEVAETAGGGVMSPGVDTDAFIEVFQWDDFRDLSPAAGGFAGSTTFLADPTTAGPGMKDTNPITDWHCVASNNLGPKFDLRQTYLAFYKEEHAPPDDHLVMFGGGVRDSNNGSAAIGFWLFRTEVACQSDPNLPNFERFVKPDGSLAEHVDGDILLVSDFTAGGRVSDIHAWRWMGDNATGSPAALVLPAGQVFGDCKDDETTTPDEMIMCGTVNAEAISPITLEWDPRSTLSGSVANQLQTGQYFEGGVDLTELTGVGVDSCVNSFILQTRASASLEAKLHDFVGGSLSTCGTIIVRKFTDPTPDTTAFTFNVTGYDPFQLADTEERIISSVLPGTYTVGEGTPPAGWTLDNAECGLDTDGDQDADTGFFDPRVADLDVGLNEVYVCTFYNVEEATLTLEKTVINDNGGTLTEDDFPRYIDGNPVSWDTPYTFTPGSSGEVHVASEDAQPGYTASTWGGDCAADGSVTLYPGDDKTCTITNDDDPPALYLIKHVINDNGGMAVAGEWTMTAGSYSVTGSETAVLATDQVGTYALSESSVAGYTNTSITCDDAPGEVTSVTIGLGETKTCTFVNDDDPAELLLIKHVISDNGGMAVAGDWTLSAGANSVTGSETAVFATDQAGTYPLSESSMPGYTNTSITCDDAPGEVTSVTIGLGETKTCTFVNDDDPAELLLIKHVINNNGGMAVAGDWTLSAGANSVTGSETAVFATDQAGTYPLSESSMPGYTNTSITCDDAPGEVTSVTIGLGETKTCTFVNNDNPPALYLIKHVINDNGGMAVAGDWTLSAGANSVMGSETAVMATDQVGTYALSESSVAGYTNTSITCDDAPGEVTSVTIGLGETKTCTFVNDDDPAELLLIKHVINNNGGMAVAGDWTLSAGANSVTGSETAVFATDQAGTYALSESSMPGYTNTSITCDDAPGEVTSVTIGLGETKTCTFVNDDDPAELLLIKHVINNNGGMAVAGDWTLSAGANSVTGSETAVFATDQAGTYPLSESSMPGYTNTSITCDDAPGEVTSVTIGLGETKTCTFVNDDDPAELLLIKHVISDNGGMAVAGDWTLSAGAISVTGSETAVFATDQAGTYPLSESSMPGYTNTSITCDDAPGEVTSVTIGLGETKTCTFVNDDIPPALLLRKLVTKDNGGTAVPADWTLCADGNCVTGSETPQLASVWAGTYALTESSVPNYTNTSITCDDAPGVEVTSVTIWLGETKTCTFVNDDDPPSLLLRKLVENGSNPGGSAVPSDWTLCAEGNCVPGSETAVEASDQAGTYDLSESSVAGYINTSITCDDAPGEVTSVTIGIGEIKTCTFVNTAMGTADLIKLSDGLLTTGTWNFSIFGPGVNATATTPPAVHDFGGVWLIPGETYTMCEMGIPSGVTAYWTLDVNHNGVRDYPPDMALPFVGSITGSLWEVYNPDALIPEDNGHRCVDFQAGIGETLKFIINNVVPDGDARTPGYWKNWSSCSNGNQFNKAAGEFFDGEDPRHITLDEVLPQTIGALFLNGDTTGGNVYDGFNDAMCAEAVLVLQSRDQTGNHKVRSSDAAYKLARSLLAYYANKSPVQPAYDCPVAAQAALDAQALLLGVGYIGEGDYLSSKGKKTPAMTALINDALGLHGILDAYNNNDIMDCSITP